MARTAPIGDPYLRALTAYNRKCAQASMPGRHPVEALSGLEEWEGKRYVALRDQHGVITVYRIKPDGLLREMRRWPKILEDM